MRERIGEVILHLSLNKKPLKSGKHAAYIRVQRKAKNRYYSCYCEFTPTEWEKFEKYPDATHPVMHIYSKFKDAVILLISKNDFSFEKLSQMTLRSTGNTLQDLIKEHITSLKSANKYGSATIYNSLLTTINDFYKNNPIDITHITKENCIAFIKWLFNERKNNPTTVNLRITCLNAVLNKAVERYLINNNPMRGIKRPTPNKRDLTISEESLSKLLNATEEQVGRTSYKYLQYWKAAYYGNGMNFTDLLLLRKENYSQGEIIFTRHKTRHSSRKQVHIPVTPKLQSILNEVSNGNTYLLKELDKCKPNSEREFLDIMNTVRKVNHHMRKITKKLNIPEKITTYTARHTFATRLLRAGIPIEYISDALGHTKITTTQNYLDGYTSEQRMKMASLLEV